MVSQIIFQKINQILEPVNVLEISTGRQWTSILSSTLPTVLESKHEFATFLTATQLSNYETVRALESRPNESLITIADPTPILQEQVVRRRWHNARHRAKHSFLANAKLHDATSIATAIHHAKSIFLNALIKLAVIGEQHSKHSWHEW